jgi:uncharacterized small protein (DUF1192 family)
MSFFEEPEPKPSRPGLPRDLSRLSIGELGDYIAELQSEIRRAEEAIAAKRRAAEGAEGLFRR